MVFLCSKSNCLPAAPTRSVRISPRLGIPCSETENTAPISSIRGQALPNRRFVRTGSVLILSLRPARSIIWTAKSSFCPRSGLPRHFGAGRSVNGEEGLCKIKKSPPLFRGGPENRCGAYSATMFTFFARSLSLFLGSGSVSNVTFWPSVRVL